MGSVAYKTIPSLSKEIGVVSCLPMMARWEAFDTVDADFGLYFIAMSLYTLITGNIDLMRLTEVS